MRQAGSPRAARHQSSLAGGLASGQQGSKVKRGYLTTSVLTLLPEGRRGGVDCWGQQTENLFAKHSCAHY